MSTRADIIIHEGDDMDNVIRLHRQSDGNPPSVVPDLQRFLRCIKNGTIRKDVEESSGWLIVWGFLDLYGGRSPPSLTWKVGTYEPETALHGDTAYRYYVDIEKLKIVVEHTSDGKKEEVDIDGICSL